jgi:S-DNA-T family DNA segregation ATPase FtsK/SpoIIIE
VIEVVRRDVLAAIIPAMPIPARYDLRSVAVGRKEDGQPWCVRLRSSHVLLAGSTGAGKASLLWGIIRTARLVGADPKLMELVHGRALFDRFRPLRVRPGRDHGHARGLRLRDAGAGGQARRPSP